jgi:hypothetical protein
MVVGGEGPDVGGGGPTVGEGDTVGDGAIADPDPGVVVFVLLLDAVARPSVVVPGERVTVPGTSGAVLDDNGGVATSASVPESVSVAAATSASPPGDDSAAPHPATTIAAAMRTATTRN